MNGVHDMGGTHGFGPIRPRENHNDEAFHADWERRLHALVYVARAQGIYNIDESRHGIERMDPADYLRSGYYERWLSSLERNLVDKGILSQEEIEARELWGESAEPCQTVNIDLWESYLEPEPDAA